VDDQRFKIARAGNYIGGGFVLVMDLDSEMFL
jgi:hypothetical protein